MTIAPVFVDSGKIAVRCDFSVKGSVWDVNDYTAYAVTLPAVTSVIFFVR
jgi:hypothetical protein